MINFFNKVIEYSFYALFILVPLVFTSNTFELFEFNKMWVTYAITLIIVFAWITKMILGKKIFIQRTPLDIPIILFFLSQLIATIISLDNYVSFWGYYSRFNGGLLSTICYIILYYAFVTHLAKKSIVRNSLIVSLVTGIIVALWGLPSHFGYDPTCFMFRGTLDVACWTEAFQPTVRIFSTLGQPDWLAAYLVVLLPIVVAYTLIKAKNRLLAVLFGAMGGLFYLDLLYTQARSGFVGFWVAFTAFLILFIWWKKKSTPLLLFLCLLIFAVISFFQGVPIYQLQKFTLPLIADQLFKSVAKDTKPTPQAKENMQQTEPAELGGTESSQIRLVVWEGALDAWRHHPFFGTGVETFAYAYYQHRPTAHNLTSEWDYLYNKAHNEFLNYLTTTGLFGLGTYLLMIVAFLVLCIKYYVSSIKSKTLNTDYVILTTGLLAGYLSILVTNFFGFSVVITNIYLFLIPAFVFVLIDMFNSEKVQPNKRHGEDVSPFQMMGIFVMFCLTSYCIFVLYRYWQADVAYALGNNLDKVGQYQEALPKLQEAVATRPSEPVFLDELSINASVIAGALAQQKQSSEGAQFANLAIASNDEVLKNHPNNVVYWKSRVRIFYSLGQYNSTFLPKALEAVQHAHTLAPTDAKIHYNLALLTGQNGDSKKAVELLQKTVQLKPDYKDAYYALGLFYRELAVDKSGKVQNAEYQQKAIETMRLILDRFSPNDKQIIDTLKSWGVQ